MKFRQLGTSGLQVSTLSLGTMSFGGAGAFAQLGTTDRADARRQVDLALDLGVNLVDTADVYSSGESETIVGEVLSDRRDRVLLSTKARFRMGDGPNDEGLSRHHLIRSLEASLRRLQTDHVDIFFCHEWDGRTPVDETLAALDDLVVSGKVRYVGLSNFSGWHLMKFLLTPHASRIVSQQIYYSLQARDAERELIPIAVDQGLGVMVWSPLAGGLLSGKYRRGVEAPSGSRRLSEWQEPPVENAETVFDVVDVLIDIANERGATPAQVALAWTLTRPAISSLVVGARTLDQLESNLGASDVELTDGDVLRLEQVSRPRLPYPYWHQANTAADRLSAADLSLLAPYLGA